MILQRRRLFQSDVYFYWVGELQRNDWFWGGDLLISQQSLVFFELFCFVAAVWPNLHYGKIKKFDHKYKKLMNAQRKTNSLSGGVPCPALIHYCLQMLRQICVPGGGIFMAEQWTCYSLPPRYSAVIYYCHKCSAAECWKQCSVCSVQLLPLDELCNVNTLWRSELFAARWTRISEAKLSVQ